MNNIKEFKKGKKVFVNTPSHGFVEATITSFDKDTIGIKYIDEFIIETYGDDEIFYSGNDIQKIVSSPSGRPFYWMFQNRKEFPEWVEKTFKQYSICDKKESKKKDKFEFLPRQKFIRDYLSHDSPYRGLLLYHDLGTGKTCGAVAASENLKDKRNIIVMLPASLKNNFKEKGIKKCGDKKYKELDGNKLIEEKYTFISYNSSNVVKQIENLGSLNNKVIIVDEAHNLATMMVNGLKGMGKQGLDVYNFLLNAKNTKIIFLTGTPLVNTPFEIAVLFNILRGFLEIVVFRIDNYTENNIDDFTNTLLNDERIGYVELNRKNKSLIVILKLHSWDMEFEQTIRFIENTAKRYNFYANFDSTKKMTLFPETEEEFDSFFIKDDVFINKDMFQRRIVGLTSYFKMTKETAKEFPEQLPEKIVEIEMSPHQYELYAKAREVERKKEIQAAQQMKKKSKEKISTLARVFSREFSNFVFPDEILRPFKKIKFFSAAMEEKMKKEKPSVNNNEINKEEVEFNKEAYEQDVREAIKKVSDPTKPYLKAGSDGLSRYSPKMETILEEINKNEKGLILLYSAYRSVEGLEIFSKVLETNGYVNFNVDKKMDPKDDFKRFAFYSGKEIKTRDIIVNNYTKQENKEGKLIKILLASSAAAEGLDLKNIRKVLIMEPYWHDVRIKQVIGRAVRKNSHDDLPPNDRNVQPIIYLSVFSDTQQNISKEKYSTDQHILNVAKKKLSLNNKFLDAVKESAIDCMLNQCENRDKCYKFTNPEPKELSYLPKIEDNIVYGYEGKQIKRKFVIAGLTNKNEVVYKKDNKWILANGIELTKKPLLQKIKYALDLNTLELFDYESVKVKGIPQKIGKVNRETNEIIMKGGSTIQITNKLSNHNKPTIAIFIAKWCPYCIMRYQIFNNIVQSGIKATIIDIDNKNTKEYPKKFKVNGIPNIKFLPNGFDGKNHINFPDNTPITKESIIKFYNDNFNNKQL